MKNSPDCMIIEPLTHNRAMAPNRHCTGHKNIENSTDTQRSNHGIIQSACESPNCIKQIFQKIVIDALIIFFTTKQRFINRFRIPTQTLNNSIFSIIALCVTCTYIFSTFSLIYCYNTSVKPVIIMELKE